MSCSIARVAVVFPPDDPYRSWQKEFFAQTGLVATTLEPDTLGLLADHDVVVLMGRGRLDSNQHTVVRNWWLLGGKAVVCVGGTWGLEEVLGVEQEGLFSKARSTPTDELLQPSGTFLFVGGEKVRAVEAEQLATSHDGFATAARNGNAWFLAPEPGRTHCLFSLGRSVGNDRVGPLGGDLFCEDGVTRAEDGSNLDWEDREEFNGEPCFLTPHVDCLRDVFVRTIVQAVESLDLACAILWHWPNNAHGAALCTVEWDTNKGDLMKRLAGALARFGTPASWLATSSGHSQEHYRVLRNLGHDFGLLYRHDNGALKSEQIRMQYVSISRLTSTPKPSACRGIDGYWHGLTVIYEAIEGAGGQVSVAKGGSRPGTSGFLFGTSRPFFPVNRTGRSIPVLEIPYTVNQPGIVTSAELAVDLAQRARQFNGCMHFTVRPSDAADKKLEEALDSLLATVRHNKLQPFLPDRLYEFERGRRAVKATVKPDCVSLATDRPLPGLTLMVSGQHEASSAGRKFAPSVCRRYGTSFTCATLDLEPRVATTLTFTPTELAA